MTDPYGQHLGNGHDHREYGHSPQQATELCIRVGLSSQNVRRIVNHLAFLRIALFRLLNLARRQRRAVLQRDRRVLDDAHGNVVTITRIRNWRDDKTEEAVFAPCVRPS